MSKMFLNRFVFTCFFILFSSFLTAQTQKELEKMSYDELKTAFFDNENDINKQKIIAKEFVEKAKKENNQSKLARGYYYYSLINSGKNKIIYFDSIINNTKIPVTDKNFPIVAYIEKGYELENQYKYNEAIDCYLEAEKIALKKNIDYYYYCKYIIAVLKSEKMGEVKESMPLIYECYKYYKENKNEPNYYYNYQNILFSLADSYKSLNQLDSATYYNKIGYIESKKTKNDDLHYLFILNEGANQFLKKNYNATIDSVNIALPKLMEMSNIGNNILAAYYYYGKAYEGLENYSKAIENYSKVDSIYQKTNVITPEFTDGYRFLIDYYKKTGNKEKQLYYINTLLAIESNFQKNYRELSQKIHKDYEIPHLMKEKEGLISSLKDNLKTNYYVIGLLGLFFVGALIFSIKQVQQKKKYKHLFDNLMASIPEEEDTNLGALVMTEPNLKDSKKTLDISDEIVLDITSKLKVFEKEKQFLNAYISIQSLAQDFNTNTKYLSSIINHTFQKSFTHYINDLRIDYIVKELKNNKQLRKFTINSIAEEAGFNTGESFSKAFFKRTGIKPSYFIKEINKT